MSETLDHKEEDSVPQPISVMGFRAGTLIETAEGLTKVEKLKAGDYLLTADGDVRPLLWVGARQYSTLEMIARDELRPIRIAPSTLGEGLPRRALWVSADQGIWINSQIVLREHGGLGALVQAKNLTETQGIRVAKIDEGVEYYFLMLAEHSLIIAEGVVTESFRLHSATFEEFSPNIKASVMALFSDDIRNHFLSSPVSPVLSEEDAKNLLLRHFKNQLPLQAEHSISELKAAIDRARG